MAITSKTFIRHITYLRFAVYGQQVGVRRNAYTMCSFTNRPFVAFEKECKFTIKLVQIEIMLDVWARESMGDRILFVSNYWCLICLHNNILPFEVRGTR